MDPDRRLDVKRDMDEDKLNTLISILNKTVTENEKLRAKYMNDPRKFAKSETELFAKLDELQSVAGQTDLYHVLIEKKVYDLLISLIFHDNLDISNKAIIVIRELIDVEREDQNEDYEDLIELLHRSCELSSNLIANFRRLKPTIKEEAEVIENSLSVISYMIGPGCMGYEGHLFSSQYIEWAIKQLKSTKFNNTKLSMVDLLITIMGDGENADHFYKKKGIAALLQQIAYYRRTSPTTGSEKEYLYQVLSCLCQCLLCHEDDVVPSKDQFFKEEGVELVELILRERRDGIQKTRIKYYMLKAFANCISPNSSFEKIVTPCCEKFIEILGLRVLFPIFKNPLVIMPKPVKRHEMLRLMIEIQELAIKIMANLLKYCEESEYLQRILIKFAEKNYEKFDHLIKILERYFDDYHNTETQIAVLEEKGEKVEEKLLNKLDHAHFVLMDLNYIFLLVCYLSDKYETYDVNSGEKFTSRFKKLLADDKPKLKEQILKFLMKDLDKSSETEQDKNSLSFLVKHMEKISTVEAKPEV